MLASDGVFKPSLAMIIIFHPLVDVGSFPIPIFFRIFVQPSGPFVFLTIGHRTLPRMPDIIMPMANAEHAVCFSVKKDADTDELRVTSHVYSVTASVSIAFITMIE